MARGQRSPLGELVYAYRTARNMTQAQLAGRIAAQGGPDGDRVSVRTISNIERRYAHDEPWFINHQATVDILATLFGLSAGSPEWQAFQSAAFATRTYSFAAKGNSGDSFITAGREWHLRRIEHELDAVANGQSGLLLVAAEGGAGKTTLLLHACRAAVERHDHLVVLWGTNTPEGHPYQPFVHMASAALASHEHASIEHLVSAHNQQRLRERAEVALRTVAATGRLLVDRIVPISSLDVTTPNQHLNAALTEIHRTGRVESDEHEFLEQAWQSIQGYAAAGPIVLVLDDLHHADAGTATMLPQLLRRMQYAGNPILILGAYRPFALTSPPDTPPPPFAGTLRELSHYVYDPVVNLGTAIGGQPGRLYIEALVSSRVKDAPNALADDIFALTEGLPLFVDAVLRWYQAEGAIQRATPTDPLQWDEPAANLPSEIGTVLGDLFARLTPPHQHLLQAASVQGTSFSADVLQQALGLTRSALIEELAMYLADRANILEPAGTRMIAGRKSYDYRFRHTLLRDFIYQQLDTTSRHDLHRQTAAAMIDLWGDETHQGAMHIARHLEQAGDRVDAAAWYLRAGDFHLFRHEHRQAIPFYQRIQDLDVIDDAPFVTVQAMVGLGNCARGLGDLSLARKHLTEASSIARQRSLPLVEANSLTSLGMVEFDLGQMRAASANLERAVDILQQLGNRVEACRSLSLLSHALNGQGLYDDALGAAESAISLAQDVDRDDLYVYGLVAKTECRLAIGDTEGAISLAERGYAIASDHADTHRMVLSALNLAHAWLERHDIARATEALDRVFAMRQSINGRMVGTGWFDRGQVALERGDLDEAASMFQRSLQLRQQHHQHALQIECEVGLLRVALARNDRPAIRQLTDSIQQQMARLGTDGVEQPARLYLTLAEAGEALSEPALAASARCDGVALLRKRAALLASEPQRHIYLHGVTANRLLLAGS